MGFELSVEVRQENEQQAEPAALRAAPHLHSLACCVVVVWAQLDDMAAAQVRLPGLDAFGKMIAPAHESACPCFLGLLPTQIT